MYAIISFREKNEKWLCTANSLTCGCRGNILLTKTDVQAKINSLEHITNN